MDGLKETDEEMILGGRGIVVVVGEEATSNFNKVIFARHSRVKIIKR